MSAATAEPNRNDRYKWIALSNTTLAVLLAHGVPAAAATATSRSRLCSREASPTWRNSTQDDIQGRGSVRTTRHYRGMDAFVVSVVCSSCGGEAEVAVKDLDEVDREVCECGYSYVVLSVAEFEPVHAKKGQLVELPRRGEDLSRAA